MKSLKDFLDLASQAYYNGQPIISDKQFDALADSIDYSPVGAASAGVTERHFERMYSLQKYYADEARDNPLEFYTKAKSYTTKLDGAAISLLYVDGVLVRALTRGDGVVGQVITDKLLATESIVPHKINHKGILQVTGEIAAPKHIPNARNYAAGSLNLKDANEFKTRALTFFAYGVYPNLHQTFSKDMEVLANMGFTTINDTDLVKLYPSDGVVYRVEDNHDFYSMGYTSKFPRGAYALKERAEHVETTLEAVEWQVGKTGKITPVAILKPVMIGDALVSRATLNNPGFIEALGLCIGDTVAVARAGEIIPCILHKVDA